MTVLRRRGWKYVILAAFDVEANYLVVKAYNYTTLTSITVIGAEIADRSSPGTVCVDVLSSDMSFSRIVNAFF